MLKLKASSRYDEYNRYIPNTKNEAVWLAIQHWRRMITHVRITKDEYALLRPMEIHYFRDELGESWCAGDCVLCQIDWKSGSESYSCSNCPLYDVDPCLGRDIGNYMQVDEARMWHDWLQGAEGLLNSLYKIFNMECTTA